MATKETRTQSMSGPPKLTKLKREDNQPPLEAYVTDHRNMSIPKNHVVIPFNEGTPVGEDGLKVTTANDKWAKLPLPTINISKVSNSNNPNPKEEAKKRHRRRSTGESSKTSAAKKLTLGKLQ